MAELIVLEGSWLNVLKYVALDVNATIVEYKLALPGGSWLGGDQWSIVYDKSTKTWSDPPGATSEPSSFNSVDDYGTSTVTVYNPEFLYGYSSTLIFKVENPWYEQPSNLYPLGSGTGLPTQLNYNPGNLMHYLVRASEVSTDMLSTRNLYYRVRNATVPITDININHTEGTQTQGYFNPTVYGVYHLERVITNPVEVHSFGSREVTQANIDAWNAANNAPPNTPRSRRGNLNFW